MSAWYDNTKANKNNPDPDQWVGFGDRTVDEMAHAWMNVTYFNEEEYTALQAERKAKLAKATHHLTTIHRGERDVMAGISGGWKMERGSRGPAPHTHA